MKMKGFKKLLVSLGLSAVLTLGLPTAAFASTVTGILASVPEGRETSDIPELSTEQVDNATYVGATSNMVQTAATTTSISVKWNPVSNATRYTVMLKRYGTANSAYNTLGTITGTSCIITKLKAGTAYNVAVLASNSTETASYYLSLVCTTLYKTVSVKSSYEISNGYTFNMKSVNPYNAIDGYKVVYTNCQSRKSVSKYYNNRYSFSLPLRKNIFYKVQIYPYVTLNGKKFTGTTPTTRYVSRGIVPKKGGNTSNSMTIKWNKVAGAQSYSVYIKYPKSSSYKRVTTTGATSYRVNNMKLGSRYYIKIAANKIVGSKTWQSDKSSTYYIYLY